jgi:hypothetical protein
VEAYTPTLTDFLPTLTDFLVEISSIFGAERGKSDLFPSFLEFSGHFGDIESLLVDSWADFR